MNVIKDQRGVALAVELALVAVVVGVIGVVAVRVGGSQASRNLTSQDLPVTRPAQYAPPAPSGTKCTIVNPDGSVTTKTDGSPCVANPAKP
jgi:Tfp pilus assembly protein PilX